jgi:hypothetical protein
LAKRARNVLKRRHGHRCDYTPNFRLKCKTVGWRGLGMEESVILRRQSPCRGLSLGGSMEKSGHPPKRVARLQRRQPRTHLFKPARPLRGCRGDNLIVHLPMAQLWSAAACCRFVAGQLAGRNLAPNPSHCEEARASVYRALSGPRASSRAESGSKLPHSKAPQRSSRRPARAARPPSKVGEASARRLETPSWSEVRLYA